MSYVRSGLGAAASDPKIEVLKLVRSNRQVFVFLAGFEDIMMTLLAIPTMGASKLNTPFGDILRISDYYAAHGRAPDLETTLKLKMASIADGMRLSADVTAVALAVIAAAATVGTLGVAAPSWLAELIPPLERVVANMLTKAALGKPIETGDVLQVAVLLGPVAQLVDKTSALKNVGSAVEQVNAQASKADALNKTLASNPSVKKLKSFGEKLQKEKSKSKPKPTAPSFTPATSTPAPTKSQPKSKTTSMLLLAGAGAAVVLGAPIAVPIAAGALAIITLKK